MRIKKGDTVLIISGKDRGKKGKVLTSFPKASRILVEGINLRKKHQKPRKAGEKGQVVEMPSPIYVSSAEIVCPKCGKAVRIGARMEGGKKFRICKKCAQEI
ncbi:MAG: 50S ribosomal protein L24 [Candidatus Nealsonbacteria bacterium]|nr:50S ribosomal protein L24 [Candidatus Nealsonbacteria bacterium]